jgi:hypothetical protein
LVFGLFLGAGQVAADSLPGDPLYGIKLMAEEVRMASVAAPASKAELARARAVERLDEVALLLESGGAVNEATVFRAQEQLRTALQTAARLHGEHATRALQQLEQGIQQRQRNIEPLADGNPDTPLQRLLRETERVRLHACDGQENLDRLRLRLRDGSPPPEDDGEPGALTAPEDPGVDTRPDPAPDPGGNGNADPNPDPSPHPGGNGNADPNPEPAPDRGGNGNPDPNPEPAPDPGGNGIPDPNPEPAPDPGGSGDPNPNPEPAPDPGGSGSPDPNPEPAPDPGGSGSPDPNPEPAPDPGGSANPEPDPDPSPDPGGNGDPDPDPDPSPDPGGSGGGGGGKP